MNPLLLAQLLQYAAFVPDAISIIRNTMAEVEKLRAGGVVTQEQLAALAAKILAQHQALPVPEDED